MPASDFQRLLDALARHQFYLEGLKAGYTQKFIDVTEELRRDIRDEFRMLDVDDMSAMSKRDLEDFIRRLSALQAKHYSVYTKQLLDDLLEFMNADLDMHADILKDTNHDAPLLAALLLAKRRDRLWVTIINAPNPANGQLTEDMIDRLVEVASFNIETTVRRAWANKATVRAALNNIVGTDRFKRRDSMLSRSIPQADAMIATIMQHISGIVQAEALSKFYDEYVWVSVMDDRTTVICRDRDGNVYIYGKGPLPPAHWRCRSHTEPHLSSERGTGNVSFSEWLERQPDKVKKDMQDGVKPLTLTEFVAKLKMLLVG